MTNQSQSGSLDADHLDILLGHMLNDPALTQRLGRFIQGHHLKAVGGQAWQAILYEVIVRYQAAHNTLPDQRAVYLKVREFTASNPDKASEVEGLVAEFFVDRLPQINAGSAPLAREVAKELMKSCVFDPTANDLITDAQRKGAIEGLSDKLRELEQQQRSVSGTGAHNNISKMGMKSGERVTTGIPWLDCRFGEGQGIVNGSLMAIIAGQGCGKCLGKGTPIRMFNGEVRKVEEVVVGDYLMGPDSRPRKVLSTSTDTGPLYRVKPFWFDSFVCNDVHILTLINIDTREIIDIPLNEYLEKGMKFKERHKLFRVEVQYPEAEFPCSPWLLGVWLGDGHSENGSPLVTKNDQELIDRCYEEAVALGLSPHIRHDKRNGCTTICMTHNQQRGNEWRLCPRRNILRDTFKQCLNQQGDKFIPVKWLRSSRQQRLELLAGLIDTDGSAKPGTAGVEFSTKFTSLRDNVRELVLSLGMYCSISPKVVNGVTYWRMYLSGESLNEIPTVIPRKKPRAVTFSRYRGNRSKFELEAIGTGEYFGFELDGDGRFLLEDFTVTHNTTFGIMLAVNQALQQRHTLLIFIEEGLTAPVQCKLLGATLGVPWPIIMKYRGEDGKVDYVKMAADQKIDMGIIEAKLKAMDEYLHVKDMVADGGSLEDILTVIQQLCDAGKKPSYVYVDWAGVLAERVMTEARFEGRKEPAMKYIAYTLAETAARQNVIIAISQQMSPDWVKKGPTYAFTQYTAADCRGFTEPAKYVCVLSPKCDRSKMQVMRWPKTRDDGALDPMIVHLRGDIPMFCDVTLEYSMAGRRVQKSHMKHGAIPVEKKQAPKEVQEAVE